MEQHLEQLKVYIRQQVQVGVSPDDITSQLRNAGWQDDQIHVAFLDLQKEMMPSGIGPQPSDSPADQEAYGSSMPQANGHKRGRIKTGWLLLKQALRLLNGNRYLLRYFWMTAIWVGAITITLIVIYFLYILNFGPNTYGEQANYADNAAMYIFVFIDYLLIYFFINLYAAGLTANILDIFDGRHESYKVYMHKARLKVGPIFMFSLIAATVGIFLEFVVERIRFVGRILSWLLGTAWSLGTMFVLPIIMSTDNPSASRSIGQSIKFFKSTWGENITAKIGVNGPLALINLASLALFFILILPVSAVFGAIGVLALIWFWIVFLIGLSIFGSFANSLINMSLYYYAVHKKAPPSFSADLLNSLIIKRKKGFFKNKTEQTT